MTMQTSHTPPAPATPQGLNRLSEVDDGVSLPEQLSAVFDGECSIRQAQALTVAYAESAELRQTWASYHCIGHALRAEREAPANPAFVAGVMARIAREEVRPAPAQPLGQATAGGAGVIAPATADEAANDAVFRWKLVAGLASLAAVVAAAYWSLLGVNESLRVERLAQRINHATDESITGRHLKNAAGTLDAHALADFQVVTENYHANRALLEVECKTSDAIVKLKHLAREGIGKTVDAGDTVADLEHLTDFVNCQRLAIVLYFALQYRDNF